MKVIYFSELYYVMKTLFIYTCAMFTIMLIFFLQLLIYSCYTFQYNGQMGQITFIYTNKLIMHFIFVTQNSCVTQNQKYKTVFNEHKKNSTESVQNFCILDVRWSYDS